MRLVQYKIADLTKYNKPQSLRLRSKFDRQTPVNKKGLKI